MKSISTRRGIDDVIFDWVVALLLIFVIAIVLVPLWYVIVVSLTPLKSNQLQGFNLFLPPNQWTLEAYQQLLGQDAFVRALLNSCIITVFGVAINMVLTTLTAYALTFKDLPGRNIFLSLILFTFLFNAGLIPTYLMVKNPQSAQYLPGGDLARRD